MLRRAPSATVTRTVSRAAPRPVHTVRLPARGYATNAPAALKYTKSHEWIKVEGAVATVGITDYAQKALGDVVFVDLPAVGKKVAAGGTIRTANLTHKQGSFGAVESVKAASDVYSPIAGEVSEVNKTLSSDPAIVNSSPYDKGWMIKLKNITAKDVEKLLDAQAYSKVVDSKH